MRSIARYDGAAFMRKMILLCSELMLCAAAPQAPACTTDIDQLLVAARMLPDTPGRAMVMQTIVAARDAHHEGDERECRSQVDRARQMMAQFGRK